MLLFCPSSDVNDSRLILSRPPVSCIARAQHALHSRCPLRLIHPPTNAPLCPEPISAPPPARLQVCSTCSTLMGGRWLLCETNTHRMQKSKSNQTRDGSPLPQ